MFLTFIINKRKGKTPNSFKMNLLECLIKKNADNLSLILPAHLSNFLHEGKHSNINNTNLIFGSMRKGIQRKLSRDDDNFASKSGTYFDHRAGETF